MRALTHSILTQRLQIEPVTPALALAARAGPVAFAETIGAEAPADWCGASLALLARGGGWAQPAPTRAVIIHTSESVVVGDLRFEPPGPGQRELGQVEIGYAIAASRRRRGYAVEAAGALICWLFDTAGAEIILAGCDKDNIGSVRTLRRLGFWLDSTPGRNFWWVLHKHPHPATGA